MQTEMTGEQELQYCIHKKRDFKAKAIKKDKEGHYIMRSIQKEDFTFINIYAPIGAPKYIKQILTYITRESNKNIIIIEDINTHSHQCTDLPYRESIWQQRS